MRALNYIRNQIEFAVKGTGRITVNQNLIDSFNDVAEFVNTQEKDTSVEDALILFYLLQVFSVDNVNNRLCLSPNDVEITNPHVAISKLFTLARPKENVIDGIYIELKAYQMMRKVPKEQHIKKKEVRKLLDDLLKDVKNFREFSMIKTKKYNYG